MEELIPITMFLGAFAMVFGIRYLSNKEKMAMIERGMDPGIRKNEQLAPRPFLSLKFGLLLVGLGLGILLALFVVMQNHMEEDQAVPVYFGCISIFGGLGLIFSYLIEKNWIDKHKEELV
ncbi:MAG: hypothetical protein JWQ28_388 [Pedobacter sp.]|jgi:hypothetical protein|nr:hypothetical protein [Pedobacter sp.]